MRSRRGQRRIAVLGVLVLVGSMVVATLAVILSQPAQGAKRPQAPTMSLSRNSVPAGGDLLVTATNLKANSLVTLQLVDKTVDLALGVTSADSNGGFRFNVAVPRNTAAGSYRIRLVAADAGGPVELTKKVRVNKVKADLHDGADSGTVASRTRAMDSALDLSVRKWFTVAGLGLVAGVSLVVAMRVRRRSRDKPQRGTHSA